MSNLPPIRVFVGCSEVERVAFSVLKFTILKHCSRDCEVLPLYEYPYSLPTWPTGGARPRTNFSYFRFLIPKWCGYHSRGIYLDSDQLVFSDIAEIFDATMPDGVNVLSACPLGKPHQNSSVMVIDCEKVRWDIDDIVHRIKKGTLDYGNLMQLRDVGVTWAPIDHEWNSLDVYKAGKTKLLHYTNMSRQPWLKGRFAHPHASTWYDALAEAVQAGAISVGDVEKAVGKRHLHVDCVTMTKVLA